MTPAPKQVAAPRPFRPQLSVPWEPRGRAFRTSLRAFFSGPRPPKTFADGPYLRGTWLRWPAPRRALAASSLWHVAVLLVLLLPIWHFPQPRKQLAPVRIELTWYEPPRDLPDISLPGPASKPSPPGELHKPLPRRGADAYHPRQTILSLPVRLTHPRQTLIQPDAPPEPPKISPPLPNIVQWTEARQPARPRLRINPSALASLRPKRARHKPIEEPAIPEVANLEKVPSQLNIASSPVIIPKPRLPVSAGTVARPSPRKTADEAGLAPELGPSVSSGEAGPQRLIALSATPAPGPPPEIPLGNLSARVMISPEGTQPGVPGGSPEGTSGTTGGAGGGPGSPGGTGGSGGTQPGVGGGNGLSGPIGISISGGSPNGNSSGSGLPSAPIARASHPATPAATLPTKPEPEPVNPMRTRPIFGPGSIDSGVPPEQILGEKRIYTLYVNMPNLTSMAGSWVLNFSELNEGMPGTANVGELVGPVPLRKVDPKYPPALISARVEGDVVLYAIIRVDGSVDSIQVLRGVDPQLDQNAMQAMARWKFRPAERNGAPVELEAVIHIPFRAVAPL